MAAAVEVFTPVFRTPDTASPSTRRRRPLTTLCQNTPRADLTLNDDAAEKKQRNKSRVTSVALSSPATPRPHSRLDSDRSTASRNGLNNIQLKDLYSSCIKLSTENKINSKNAFGLQLIDYMQDLIKTVKEGDMTNFQVASCTLDASAKIYAGRVDSIHTQAYKMLSGFGRTENEPDNQGANPGEEDSGHGGKQKTRKAHSKPGNTIESNIKNLNVNQFDLEFEVDPLFHKTSAAFDEGGTIGLLMNHLCIRDDTCEILLDSNAVTMDTRVTTTKVETSQDSSMVDLSDLRDVYSSVNFQAHQICPYFSEFEFTKWNKDDQGDNGISNIISNYKNDEHAFDLDAPATEVEYPEPMGGDYSDTEMTNMPEDMEYGHDRCDLASNDRPAAYCLGNATLAFADGQAARLITNQDPKGSGSNEAARLGSLCMEISDQPNEYSYFKSSVLATWAGPEHWKAKARLSKLAGISASTDDQATKKKRPRKEPFKVDFDKDLDVKQYFSKGRASTKLAKSTRENMSAIKNALPEDLHYNADYLFRLFTKTKIMVRRQAQQTELADDGSEWYNYDNANDAANFCPGIQDEDDDSPSSDMGQDGQNLADGDGFNTDMTYDTSNTSQGLSFNNEAAIDVTMFAGDGLVAQPNKVAKIDINYAKTAKKMDVKKLKGAMWTLLNKQYSDTDKELIENTEQDEKSFKDIYQHLPALIPKQMANNLSVPIAFVCILHLANEKCLKMDPEKEMGNFGILLEKN